MAWPVVSRSGLFAVALSLAAMPASAEIVLPPAGASASSRSRAPGSARTASGFDKGVQLVRPGFNPELLARVLGRGVPAVR